MTPELAAQWIAYATRLPIDHVHEIGLDDQQLITIGAALARANITLIPERPTIREKTIEVVCACGCGETFTATYRTKRPKYKNEAHRKRAQRRRQRERHDQAQQAQRGQPIALQRNGRGFKVARSA